MMISRLKSYMRRFAEDTRGVISVEMVFILPLLLWSFAAVATFFDAYRARSLADKAAFTISDMLSRETNAVTATYVTNARLFFDELASSSSDSSLRISVISYSSALNGYRVNWSEARGSGFEALVDTDMVEMAEHLPNLASGDSLILVETSNQYEPIIDVGIGDLSIDTFVFSRSRYAPNLAFSG